MCLSVELQVYFFKYVSFSINMLTFLQQISNDRECLSLGMCSGEHTQCGLQNSKEIPKTYHN